tara:strand:+ start:7458 stop:8435 length:978 start_codon:yes stop_codon:yes gene_type:complete
MLGKQIKELRLRNEISLEELAHKSGLSVDALGLIEEDNIEHLEDSKLLKIADNLRLKSAYDFACLMKSNKAFRRFHAYVVGLPKTGTVSLAAVFGNYRSLHEFHQRETHQMIIKLNQGEISKKEFSQFIRKRDFLAGFLEMDAAHFNRHYIDILAEEFPKAKFLCLIRDCYSWLNSCVNFYTHLEKESLQVSELPNGMPFDLPIGSNIQKEELVKNFKKYIDVPLTFWTTEYKKILEKLPSGRSMIIKTNEISGKLDEIARLMNVSYNSLITEQSHLNKADYGVDILYGLDKGFLKAKFKEHCSDLMEEFFPGYSLQDYFKGRKL